MSTVDYLQRWMSALPPEGFTPESSEAIKRRIDADEAEFALIQAKKSKLSAQQRRNVGYRVERRRLLLEYYAANHRPDADDLDVAPVVLDLGTGTVEELQVQLDAHPGYALPKNLG